MKNKKINIGLIGYGVVGERRLNNLPKFFNLIGCADPNIFSSSKKKLGNNKIFLTKNWKDLIKLKSLEAVIISTTHHLHSDILLQCIKLNLHVFIEKPAGISEIKTKKIISKLKSKKNLRIRVGFNHRYHPAFLMAKKMIQDNKIGPIMYIRAVYGHGGRLNYNQEWRFKKKFSGGGELIDKGSHLIDLSRIFLGNLKPHTYKLNTYFWDMKLEDNCFLILKNNKDKVAFLHSSCTEWKNKFIFEIFGKTGKIEINGLGKSYGQESLTYYKMSKKMGIPKKKLFIFKHNENYSWNLELKEFYTDIIKKRVPQPGILEAYENLKLISSIYKQNDNN